MKPESPEKQNQWFIKVLKISQMLNHASDLVQSDMNIIIEFLSSK